jgi:hypothetical protein
MDLFVVTASTPQKTHGMTQHDCLERSSFGKSHECKTRRRLRCSVFYLVEGIMTTKTRTAIATALRMYAQGLISKEDAMHQIKAAYFLTGE